MRICLVYDCLYPYTVGGAERWYRNLAERLAAERPRGHLPDAAAVGGRRRATSPACTCVAVGPRMELYARRPAAHPPARSSSAWACSGTCSATGGATTSCTPRRFRTSRCWRRPLFAGELASGWSSTGTRSGRARTGASTWAASAAGSAGASSELRAGAPAGVLLLAAARAAAARGGLVAASSTRLEGQYAGPARARSPSRPTPVVVFAGRHIPEKRVPALVPALARARRQLPELRGEIYGDGPERPRVLRAIARARPRGRGRRRRVSSTPRVLDEALARALCLVLPSRREGYGLVVVEAAARGAPVVVVAGPDNAAIELVEEGVNGVVAASAEPDARSPPRSCASTTAGPSCASPRPAGFAETPNGCRSSSPSNASWRRMPSRERSVLHVLPHAGGGGDTYVDVLTDMTGYTFNRVYVAPKRKPGVGDLVAGAFDLRRVLRGYDLLHIHGEGAAGMFLPLLAAKRSVVTLHGLHLLRRATGVRHRVAELNLKAVVRAADRTICVSSAERDVLKAATGPAGVRRTVVVHNGVRVTPATGGPIGPGFASSSA